MKSKAEISLPVNAAFLDCKHRIISISGSLARLVGISGADKAVGADFLDCVKHENSADVISGFLRGGAKDDCIVQFKNGGEKNYFKIIYEKNSENSENPESWYIQFVDVSALVSAKEAAEAANRAKSDFLAMVSHEIRTPMNAILGISMLMSPDNLNDIQKKCFGDIKKMSGIMLNIVNEILDFSKIEAGKLALNPVNFRIVQLFDYISSIFKFMAEDSRIDFVSRLDNEIPHVLFCDENRLRQIYTNIINNAIKYTKSGIVWFTLKSESINKKKYLTAVVEDTGIGIKEEDLPFIFNVFEQVDVKRNREIPGAGLGLAITKNLVDLMHGVIEVKSKYGNGTKFTVRIPLVKGEESNIEEPYESCENFVYAKNKEDVNVLVVDDIPENIAVASGFLAKHNIAPDSANTGELALDMIRKKKYDIIFMDHIMLGMDGIETTKKIRDMELGKDVPVIALSANAVKGYREFFLDSGMNDFISKPILPDEMNAILIRWLPAEKITRINRRKSHRRIMARRKEGGRRVDDEYVSGELLTEVSEIPGLNIIDGLMHTGGTYKSYTKVLRQFCNNLDNETALIEEAALGESWSVYATKLHGYRGIFSILGFEILSVWAKRLEYAARFASSEWNENTPFESGDKKFIQKNAEAARGFCKNETPVFLGAAKIFRSRLFEAGIMTEASAGKNKASRAHIFYILTELRTACAGFKAKPAQRIAGEIKTLSAEGEMESLLKEIASLVETHDYAEALGRVDAALKITCP